MIAHMAAVLPALKKLLKLIPIITLVPLLAENGHAVVKLPNDKPFDT
jgi:hypothetical protein